MSNVCTAASTGSYPYGIYAPGVLAGVTSSSFLQRYFYSLWFGLRSVRYPPLHFLDSFWVKTFRVRSIFGFAISICDKSCVYVHHATAPRGRIWSQAYLLGRISTAQSLWYLDWLTCHFSSGICRYVKNNPSFCPVSKRSFGTQNENLMLFFVCNNCGNACRRTFNRQHCGWRSGG